MKRLKKKCITTCRSYFNMRRGCFRLTSIVWHFDTCHLNTSVPLTQGGNRVVLSYGESEKHHSIPWLSDKENVLCFPFAVYLLSRDIDTNIPSREK